MMIGKFVVGAFFTNNEKGGAQSMMERYEIATPPVQPQARVGLQL
jgi:hypothetical protein